MAMFAATNWLKTGKIMPKVPVQVEGAPLCAVDCEPDEMKAFLAGLLPAFKVVADKAKVFPELRRQHLIENYALFGLTPDEAVLKVAGAIG